MTGAADPRPGLLASGRFAELEEALCERVAELKRGRPLEPLTIVVGSAAVRTRVGDLLVRRLEAIANVGVVTLARLAGDLIAEGRGAPRRVLAGLARERFLRRLLDEHRGRLSYFGPVVDRPHLAAALAATFADLREGCVDPGSGWQAAVAYRKKAADLDLLYRAYCDELLRRGLLDDAGLFLAAAGAAAGAALERTILYGIYDLNEAQTALVDALIAAGADVLVPTPRYRDDAGAAVREAALAGGLTGHRREAPVEGADRDRIAAVWRRDADRKADDPLTLQADGTLGVVSVADERAETREAVRAVVAAAAGAGDRQAVRSCRGDAAKGASLWDCAIVVPHGDDVERIAAALQAAGSPVACRLPDRSVGPRLLRRLADCLAPSAGMPFARRAVVDLFCVAPLRRNATGPAAMALWLDEARRAGVVAGLEQWRERCEARVADIRRRLARFADHPAAVADDRDEVADRGESLERRLAAASGLCEAARALERACGGIESLRASWSGWAEKLEGVIAALFEAPASDAARDAVGRLHGLAVVDEDEDVGVGEVADVLRLLLDDARRQEGRVGRHGVAVLTPLELRGLRFHTVVFTGLAEGGFPVRGRPDPILGDLERERIDAGRGRDRGKPGVRLPRSTDRAAESELLFAFACEAARERLVLLAPRTEAETGRPRLASRLILRLATLVAGRPIGHDDFLDLKHLDRPVWAGVGGSPAYEPHDEAGEDERGVAWIDARERDSRVLVWLSQHAAGDAARGEYLAAVLGDAHAARRRLAAWDSARSNEPTAWDGLFDDRARAELAKLSAARRPLAGELSPTRLERYIGCPFAFLLRDVFGLEAPDEPGDSLEIDHLEFGSLVHDILESAYRRVIDEELALDGALEALTGACERFCAEAEHRGVTGAGLSWRARREMLLEDLVETLNRDPVFTDGDGRPVAVEWMFGDEHQRAVVLDLGGGREVRFRGRIDRFDVTPSGARVIDYKTGAGFTERERIKAGLSVQLPVYRLAVRKAAAGRFAEIESLYRFVTRRGGFATEALPGSEESADERLRELVSGVLDLVEAGVFPRSTEGRCDHCDVGYACGVTPWARARKREHEKLAGVVRLQRPATREADDGI